MAEKKKIDIDITQIELDQGAKHWLSPHEKNPEMAERIRKKHRDKYLAEKYGTKPKPEK